MKRTVKLHQRQVVIACAFMVGGVFVIGGCSTPRNPFVHVAPPTTVEPRAHSQSPENRTVIVLGQFLDPTKAPMYSQGVGKCMSEALSRALLHEGTFDVWINPQLSRAVEGVIALPTYQQEEGFGAISTDNPRVHYVITGKVTDFYHTSDLPSEASRWGILGKRNEAIVAVDLRIVDLKTRRIVGADHLKATAGAGSSPSGDVYGGIALDSYLFWSTPLGRASKSVVEHAVERTSRVVPAGYIGEAHVASLLARRQLSITGGTDAGLAVGREYYLVAGNAGTQGAAVYDPDTGRPVMVRIDSVSRHSATGILRGQAPIEQEIRGAALRTTLPPASAANQPAAIEQPQQRTAVEP